MCMLWYEMESSRSGRIGGRSFKRGNEKGAKQMRWEVEKVVLLDGEDNECDPFNVPEDFWPTTIAIHLGKKL